MYPIPVDFSSLALSKTNLFRSTESDMVNFNGVPGSKKVVVIIDALE